MIIFKANITDTGFFPDFKNNLNPLIHVLFFDDHIIKIPHFIHAAQIIA